MRITPGEYAAAVMEDLPALVADARKSRGLSLRAAAREMGLSPTPVRRCEAGEGITLAHAIVLVRWTATAVQT